MTDGSLEQYDYQLPRDLIAQRPLASRADARLLVVRRATAALDHRHVRDLPDILSGSDCLVSNDTRVVPARLLGHRAATGGHWEGLFLSADRQGLWHVLSKTRGKLRLGEHVTLTNAAGTADVQLRFVQPLPEGGWIVRPESDEESLSLLERVGRVPLPHYIRRGDTGEDRHRYQTVFARHPGAVAAPTAGLHFTEELIARLTARGVSLARVTLHVGLDTFRPVTADTLDAHRMHSEWCRIDQAAVLTVQNARRDGGRIVAVGTTVARVLETAAAGGELVPWTGKTDLFIRPPYEFRAVSALLTNFHLPRTTLLVLVQTFGGDDLIRRAYQEAISQRYRFYSYGDAMLIL